MIKKRYVVLTITGILIYGLFMYEPDVNESEVKKYMAIEVTDENVDMQLADALDIHVDQDKEQPAATVKIADAIKIRSDETTSAVNILGAGADIENDEDTQDSSITKSEVSIKNDNPLILRAGNTVEKENKVIIDGVGIGELYELNGHDLEVDGIKNIINIKGSCDNITVNGIACIIRVEKANTVTIAGIGNRVYVDGKLLPEKVTKDGILNFVFHE